MERAHGRRWALGGAVVAAVVAAAVIMAGVGVLWRPTAEPAAVDNQRPTGAIALAQERLRRLPGDWVTWAELGAAFVQRARATADPADYSRAEDALRHSLAVRPLANAPAQTGLGTLAAARHDFAAALDHARQAVRADPYRASAYGVMTDALVELGRYDEAWRATQRMLDLLPDTGSYARASYSWELRGDLTRARRLMTQALEVAPTAAEVAFARLHLAELALGDGDLRGAQSHVDAGLARAPTDVPLLAERARIAAARGDLIAAIAGYRAVLGQMPQPQYAAELGDLLTATGDRAGAEEQYALVETAARLLAAQGVRGEVELALFHADHGQPARALAEARAGFAARPSITAADALAWALHVNGRDAEALPHAQSALRLGTRNALFRYHRGMIRAALGERGAARADLTEALRLNPRFSVLQAPVARAALADSTPGRAG